MSRLKRNTQYNIGDVVNALPNYTLTCTKAGTTSADPITVQEGTIIDGTCEWNCVNNVGGGGGGAVEDWEAGKTYKVNQLVKSDSKLYICMNEHISSSAFATDLLAGNWGFIGGAGYSNVIMDTIYEGDVQVTATTGHDTYTLASSADNYDYAICTVKIYQTKGILIKETAVVPANSSQAISWSYGIGSGSANIETYGWVSFTADKTSISFALRAKGSAIASASLERVDAIKVNSMTLSEIAELSMPSDVYESFTHNFTDKNATFENTAITAPANGHIVVNFSVYPQGSVNIVTIPPTRRGHYYTNATPSTRTIYLTMPIGKNETFNISTLLCKSTSTEYVRFYYSIGDAKELGLID